MADALLKSGLALHFYRNEHAKRKIDFLVQVDGAVVPVETKGGRASTNSLTALMKASGNVSRAYKVSDANIGKGDSGIVTIPHYMATCI